MNISRIVLPVRSRGLWSTMFAFIALEKDFNTVAAINYFEHAETPGLGDEIEEPDWQALWRGRKVYDDAGQPRLRMIRRGVNHLLTIARSRAWVTPSVNKNWL